MSDSSKTFICRKKIEFHETDMAGIVHFSNFFRYMEFAEARFFESLDEKLIERSDRMISGWPRVEASCKYKRPLHFGDTLCIKLEIQEIKIRAIVYQFTFYKNEQWDEVVARGSMTTVYAESAFHEPMTSASIPAELAQKLTTFISS